MNKLVVSLFSLSALVVSAEDRNERNVAERTKN